MFSKMKMIALLALLPVLLFFSGCSEDNPVSDQQDHFKPYGVKLISGGVTILEYYKGVSSDTLSAPLGSMTDGIDVKFFDENKNVINPPTDTQKKLSFTFADASIATQWQHPGEEGGYEFHIKGLKLGNTNLTLRVMHNDHADFTTIPFPVFVREVAGSHGEPEGFTLRDEESDSLLAKVNANGTVEGSLKIKGTDSTDHMVVKFFDGSNIEFWPASPEHTLKIEIANNEIAGFIAPTIDEPWAFKVFGKKSGTTTFVISILHNGSVDKVFVPVSIIVN